MVDPTRRQDPDTGFGDAVVTVELAEPGEIACRRVDVRRSHEVAGIVELRDGRVHAHRSEQPVVQLADEVDELTNLRAVRDPDSSTGWSLEIGPFPGWETVPTW